MVLIARCQIDLDWIWIGLYNSVRW